MAFERHPTFKQAPDKNSRLWQYMGLRKYLSLLQRSALFFCNLELIARNDPFEGTLPSSRFRHRSWNSIEDMPVSIQNKAKELSKQGNFDAKHFIEQEKRIAELRIRQAYAYRRSYFINCWHLSEFESPAMWDIYSKRNEGIAILSSEALIEEAFAESNQNIMGGIIIYGDFFDDDFKIDDKNAFSPVLNKRISFEHEKEYRLVHWDTTLISKNIKSEKGFFIWDDNIIPDSTIDGRINVSRSIEEIEQMDIKPGLYLDCDINKLIESTFISPLAENWFIEIVNNVSKKYGLEALIKQSELNAEPLR